MVKDIFTLASHYQDQLQPFTKTAAKEKMNRGRMNKTLERAKGDYAKLKKDLDILEADDAKLKDRLDSTRSGAAAARKKMLQIHKALSHMDLANASDAIFYADDDDVGYMINGKECHLDVDDVGDVKLTPMSAHRKSKKPKKDEACADDNCADDSHDHPAKDQPDSVTAMEADDTDFDDLYASLVE